MTEQTSNTLSGIAAILAAGVILQGVIKAMVFASLKHYTLADFGKHALYLVVGVITALDRFADLLGAKPEISKAEGATLRFGEDGTSQHYFGRAIDIILPPGVKIAFAVEMAKKAGFSGIGIYPNSGGIKGRWRMHVDTRPGRAAGNPSTWSSIPTGGPNDARRESSLAEALTNFA